MLVYSVDKQCVYALRYLQKLSKESKMHYVPNCPTNHQHTKLKEELRIEPPSYTITMVAYVWCDDCTSRLEPCDKRAIETINAMYAIEEKKLRKKRYTHAT